MDDCSGPSDTSKKLKAIPKVLENSSPSPALVGGTCVVGVSQSAAKADIIQEKGSHVPSLCLLTAFDGARHSTEYTDEKSLTSSNPDIISLQGTVTDSSGTAAQDAMTSTLTESSFPGDGTDRAYASPNPTARQWDTNPSEENPPGPTTTPRDGEGFAPGLATPKARNCEHEAPHSDIPSLGPITPEALQERRQSSEPDSASSTHSAPRMHSLYSADASPASAPGPSPAYAGGNPTAGVTAVSRDGVSPDRIRPASPDDGPAVSPTCFGLRNLACVTWLAGPQQSAPQPLAEAVLNPARNCTSSFPCQNSLILDRNLSTGSGWSALIARTPTAAGSVPGSPLSPVPRRLGLATIGGSPLAPGVFAPLPDGGGVGASSAATTPGRWARSCTAPSTPASYSSAVESAGEESSGGLSESEADISAAEDADAGGGAAGDAGGGNWVNQSFKAAIYNAVRNQLEVESEKEMMRKLAAATGAAAPAGGGGLPQEADWARGAGRPIEATTRKLAACFERAIHDAMEARPSSAEGRAATPSGATSACTQDVTGSDAIGAPGSGTTCRRLARYFDQAVHEAMDGRQGGLDALGPGRGQLDSEADLLEETAGSYSPEDPAIDEATCRRLAKSFEIALQQVLVPQTATTQGQNPSAVASASSNDVPTCGGTSLPSDVTPGVTLQRHVPYHMAQEPNQASPSDGDRQGASPGKASPSAGTPGDVSDGQWGQTQAGMPRQPTPVTPIPTLPHRRPASLDVTPQGMSAVRMAALSLEAGGVPAFIPSPSGPRPVAKVITSKPASRLVSGPKAPPPLGIAFLPSPRPGGGDDAPASGEHTQPVTPPGVSWDRNTATTAGAPEGRETLNVAADVIRREEVLPDGITRLVLPGDDAGGSRRAEQASASLDKAEEGEAWFVPPTPGHAGGKAAPAAPSPCTPASREAFDDLLGSLVSVNSAFEELIETMPMTDEMRESYGNLSTLFGRRSIDSFWAGDPSNGLTTWASSRSAGAPADAHPARPPRERTPSKQEALAEASSLMVDRSQESADDILELMLAVDTQDLWDLLSPNATVMDMGDMGDPASLGGRETEAPEQGGVAGDARDAGSDDAMAAGLPRIRTPRPRSPVRPNPSRPRARFAARGLAVRAPVRSSIKADALASPTRRPARPSAAPISFAPRVASAPPPIAVEEAVAESSPRGFGPLPIAALPIGKLRSPGAAAEKPGAAARSPVARRSPLVPRAALCLPQGSWCRGPTEADLAAMPGAVSPRANSTRSSSDGTPLASPNATPDRSPYSKETARQYAPVFSTEELNHTPGSPLQSVKTTSRVKSSMPPDLPPLQEATSPRSCTSSPNKRIGQVVASIQEELLARASMDSVRAPTGQAALPVAKSTEVKDIISMFQAAALSSSGTAGEQPRTVRGSSEGIPPLAPRNMAPRSSADNAMLRKWRNAEELEIRSRSKLSITTVSGRSMRNLSEAFEADSCAQNPSHEIWPPEKHASSGSHVTHVHACAASLSFPGDGSFPEASSRYAGFLDPGGSRDAVASRRAKLGKLAVRPAPGMWGNEVWPPEAASSGNDESPVVGRGHMGSMWPSDDSCHDSELDHTLEETLEHAVSFDALVGW